MTNRGKSLVDTCVRISGAFRIVSLDNVPEEMQPHLTCFQKVINNKDMETRINPHTCAQETKRNINCTAQIKRQKQHCVPATV